MRRMYCMCFGYSRGGSFLDANQSSTIVASPLFLVTIRKQQSRSKTCCRDDNCCCRKMLPSRQVFMR